MESNPHFIIPDELCYGYLRFEGNGKIPLGRQGKKVCPVGCLSLVLLAWYSILGLDAMPLSLKNLLSNLSIT